MTYKNWKTYVKKNPQQARSAAIDLIVVLLVDRINRTKTGLKTDSHESQCRRVVSQLLWKHSEAWGKYEGCPYWTQYALKSKELFGKTVTSENIAHGSALRHEHLFPRKELINFLFDLSLPSVESVSELVNRLNVGVVVTVEEHNRLSINGVEHDPWERYKHVGIEVVAMHQVDHLPKDFELPANHSSGIVDKTNDVSEGSIIEKKKPCQYRFSVNGTTIYKSFKNRMMLYLISYLITNGIDPDKIRDTVPWLRNRLIRIYQGKHGSDDARKLLQQDDVRNNGWVKRYFLHDEDILHFNGKTYLISNQWGSRTFRAFEALSKQFPEHKIWRQNH